MHKTKPEFYENIKDKISKKEFEKEIKKMKKEYDNLFDEDTVALLIVDKLGRNKQNKSKISDLNPGVECTIFGKITHIGEARIFERKNGSSGRVINLELTDDTGSCGLVLWDQDVELIKNNKIKEGSNVNVVNGYIKNGFTGLEINIGRWSMLEIEPKNMPELKNIVFNTKNEIKGKLVGIEPTRAFFKDDGSYGFVANIKIKDNSGTKQLAVWDEKVKEIQCFKQGDLITINNINMRQKNGTKELHVNGKGIIKKL